MQVVKNLKFATPNQVAFDQLSPELKQDQTLFPTPATLEKLEGITPIADDISAIFDDYWTRLTSA
jgi:spermidine/putrescine transport system substrate-binding protein